MNKKNGNEELLHRREFFKKSVKTALPIVAAISIPSFLFSCSKDDDDDDSDSGNNSNSGSGNNSNSGSGNNNGDTNMVSPADATLNGHGYVDLGLSVKWAICNYGASSIENYGTRCPGVQGTYDLAAYYWKNCLLSGSKFDRITNEWGSKWRTPTLAQFTELINNTTQSVITYNGIKGLLFKSNKNKKTLFMPFAGHRDYYNGKYTEWERGTHGYYWAGDAFIAASMRDMGYMEIWQNSDKARARAVKPGYDIYEYELSIRAVTSSSGQTTGCNNSCANNSTNSGCSNCSSSCSSGCKTNCDYNCAATCKSHCYGQCNDTCGGGCKAASKGSSCSGCATTCYNRCYHSCSYACSSNCESSCVRGAK